jgi:hypothetical protein
MNIQTRRSFGLSSILVAAAAIPSWAQADVPLPSFPPPAAAPVSQSMFRFDIEIHRSGGDRPQHYSITASQGSPAMLSTGTTVPNVVPAADTSASPAVGTLPRDPDVSLRLEYSLQENAIVVSLDAELSIADRGNNHPATNHTVRAHGRVALWTARPTSITVVTDPETGLSYFFTVAATRVM